jgi:3-oxoacid CoA-transferase A subunit
MATGQLSPNALQLSAEEAMKHVKDGSRIMVGGFGNVGVPYALIEAIAASGVKDLTIMSNDLGSPNIGLGKLLVNNQIRACIGNYYNWNYDVAMAKNEGRITVELVPQGTFAEKIRAGGVGIAAFFTPTGVRTDLSKGKETKWFNNREYMLEEALRADVALIKAHKADELGNLIYYKTARNFNPLMALAADLVIAEVDEIVPVGLLDPEIIITPHLYTYILVKGGN